MNTVTYSVGIAGAGIGGLTLAILLKQMGHRPEIFERFAIPKPVGSGLVIQPVGKEVLRHAGVADDVIAQGAQIYRMLGHKANGRARVLDVWYDRADPPVEFGLAVQRRAVFDALYKRALALQIPIHTGHAIAGRKATQFIFDTGGMFEPFDLLVDSSGARSQLSPLSQTLLPFGALWATVDWTDAKGFDRNLLGQRYLGAHKMMGIMPSGRPYGATHETATLFWSLPHSAYAKWQNAGLAAWRQEAEAFWPEAAPFISQIQTKDDFTMARYSHGTLRTPYQDRLVFLGDAAHRASPQLGQGANMALLDAYALAYSLHTNGPDQAGVNYARRRRAHVRLYQWASWLFTPMYQSRSRVLPVLRDYALFPGSQLPVVRTALTAMVKGTLLNPFKAR